MWSLTLLATRRAACMHVASTRMPSVRLNLPRVFCRKISQDTGKLFSAISDLDKYGIRLKSFPNVAVIGPQSSGKSSVIEALCGQSILPKGMRMATLKPVHLTTIKSGSSII